MEIKQTIIMVGAVKTPMYVAVYGGVSHNVAHVSPWNKLVFLDKPAIPEKDYRKITATVIKKAKHKFGVKEVVIKESSS